MGTRPHLWAAVLSNAVVVALAVAGCSVFEAPPVGQDGGGGAGGAPDTGVPSEAGIDGSVDRNNVDVSSDPPIGADGDSSVPDDSTARGDVDARDERVADGDASDASQVDTGTDG